MKEILEYIESNSERYVSELQEFLRIPSISTDVGEPAEMKTAAEFVASQLEQAGMSAVEIFATDGHPIVWGERIEDPNLPTVLVYGHYDVQPVDPVELWEFSPFDPIVRDGQIYARGATDDKGQMMIHFKSAEAFAEVRGKLPVNLKFVIEGEEEIGSVNLEDFIRGHVDLLKTDTVLISDTAFFARGVPSICYGLRGLAYMEITLTGPKGDLHSGSFGGPVANPAFVLCQIVASMKDDQGRVTIPGFYDDVVPLTQREKDEWAALPFDVEAYKAELGVAALDGEAGFTPLEQVWARPTLEVNGLGSGFTGEGAKTVLPSTAMAKISMRLVPDQDYRKIEKLFEDYVKSVAPPTVQAEVKSMHGGKPWVASLDDPALVTAARAIEAGFGKRPVFQREGGSIPIVATFTELLEAPCLLMGIGLPDENAHAPNERLDLSNFFGGIRSSAFFLKEFSTAAHS
jgi:acetylornithine deacetylase/succinyl-diaminopimelate desuccinylase-like protein